jgi:hypothetical protein
VKIALRGNASLELFEFVTLFHREVVLRHLDGTSQDIEMSPDEAEEVAYALLGAAVRARRQAPR